MVKYIISVSFLILALIHTGYALKCYACDSTMKGECNDPFSKDSHIPLNECPSGTNKPACMKISIEAGGKTKLKRYCLMHPESSKPCEYATSQIRDGMVKECESCTEDGCNAAGSISASTFAIFGTCLFAAYNMYQRA